MRGVALGGRFATTSWTLVLSARDQADSTLSRAALAELCRAYWPPLYAYLCRTGHDREEARDLTQAYFAELLEKDFLHDVAPEKGRFRTFLLTSLEHVLAREGEKARALKRGGGNAPISLENEDLDIHYRAALAHDMTPEKVFEKNWAMTVLRRTLERLREAYVAQGNERMFEKLKGVLTGAEPALPYREVAAQLEMTEDAVKMAVHRLRKRFGRGLRDEIAETVSSPEEVDDEVRHLLHVLSE